MTDSARVVKIISFEKVNDHDLYHLFCVDGGVRRESDCPHHDARGEEYVRCSATFAEYLARVPVELRWQAAQDE